MSSDKQRLVFLVLNILKIGVVNLVIDLLFILLLHSGYNIVAYFYISVIIAFLLIAVTTILTFIKIKEKLVGKLIYAFLGFLLSSILFIFTTVWIGALGTHW